MIRGDHGGVIWRTFKTIKPKVCRGHYANAFGSSSLLNIESSKKIRMTEVIEDTNAATDYRRPSLYKSSYSNDISPKLKYLRDDDSVMRNTKPLVCGRDAEFSNMIQTKSEKEVKVCSKSFEELKYIADPIVLKQFSKKEKENHLSLLSTITPKKTGVYRHAIHKSYKECEKKHEENEKASDRRTKYHCNRDSLLLEENQRFK